MASNNRDKLRIIMTSAQIAEAQRLSREFVPRKEQAGKSETVFQREATIKGFGTGFFISDDGLFVTAAHVVQGASEVKVLAQNREYNAKTLFADSSLDIAVLHVEGARGVGSLSVVPSGPVRTGDAVFTLGFPQVQLQGAEAKFTDGSISSLSGIGGDPKFFQISVPVQPGNSGGPLLDASGNVVGIVVSRLDAIETLLATGSLPQNVNYALKSSFVLPLLESLPGVSERLQKPVKLDRPAAIEKTKNAVGLVVCVE
jgi:S1-C subfamily serine protease